MAGDSRNVLVVYSNNRLVPGNVAVDRGLRAVLTRVSGPPTQIYSEFLDRPDFGGAAYETTVKAYLHDKYAARPPDAIVGVSDEAVDFLVRHRDRLFPGVPLVHVAASPALLRSMPGAAGRRGRRARRVRHRGDGRAGVALASECPPARGRDRRLAARPRARSPDATRSARGRRAGAGRVPGRPADRVAAAATGRTRRRRRRDHDRLLPGWRGPGVQPPRRGRVDGGRGHRPALRPARHLHRHRRGGRADGRVSRRWAGRAARSSTRCSPARRHRPCACPR